jgi:orotidine-5'-phosphate decarboxylase
MSLITRDHSIIPACDVPFSEFMALLDATADLDGIGAYKLGAALGLSVGLPTVVKAVRDKCAKPVIYDHQKAGTDIPDTAKFFMQTLFESGIDAVILFPHAGPATQRAWVSAGDEAGLEVIVGGLMTHDSYLASEGGYIRDDAPSAIYENASSSGVSNFVVPGNKPDAIRAIKDLVSKHCRTPIFYAPGFVTQGGQITDAARAAGSRWHAIVGRAILEAPDMRDAALSLCSHLQ